MICRGGEGDPVRSCFPGMVFMVGGRDSGYITSMGQERAL